MLNRRFHLLLNKDLWNKIVKRSQAQKISAGEYIRRAIEKYLNTKEEVQKENNPSRFKDLFKGKNN